MKNDYEQQIESISKEWEFRVKAAEEKTRNLNQVKSDLE